MGIIIALIVVGLIFLALEMFLFPGTTVLGIIGGIILLGGITTAYLQLSSNQAHLILVGSLILGVLIFFFGFKAIQRKGVGMTAVIGGRVNEESRNLVIGDMGITIGDLKLSGKAEFYDNIYEVQSIDGFVDHGITIEIVKIVQDHIYVQAKNQS